MVHDFVELDGEQMVNLGNTCIDHGLRVFGDRDLPLQNLADELFHKALAAFSSGGVRSHPSRLDNLIQKSFFADLLGSLRCCGRFCFVSHCPPPFPLLSWVRFPTATCLTFQYWRRHPAGPRPIYHWSARRPS